MGRKKQISCKVCSKVMRSDNVKRHMKKHIDLSLEDPKQLCKRKHRRKHKMESMQDNTLSSTKVKNEEKNMTTEQVDVSYSQRPAIDKDQLKKLLKNLSEEYNHKITMGEIVHDIMREEKVAEEVLKPEMKEALELYVKKTMKEKKSKKK